MQAQSQTHTSKQTPSRLIFFFQSHLLAFVAVGSVLGVLFHKQWQYERGVVISGGEY